MKRRVRDSIIMGIPCMGTPCPAQPLERAKVHLCSGPEPGVQLKEQLA
ncbi:MAG: hypothetical protein AB7U63_18470 [Porticoccaceae bacterium]